MNQYNSLRYSALRGLAATVIVLSFSTAVFAQFQITNFNGVPVVADEFVIRLRGAGPAAAARLRNGFPGATVEAISQQLALHRVRLPGQSMAGLMQALSNHPDVLYAEPNYVLRAATAPNDTFYSSQWGMSQISAPLAWEVTTGGTSAVIGVVDTGVDYKHPDLAENIWSAPSAFSVVLGPYTITCPAGSHGYNAITRSCDPQDDNNHGTHVAGTIAATGNNNRGVAGVNWTARVMGLKFLDSLGFGTTVDAISAIEFARQVKLAFASTATPVDIRILSNSWVGGNRSEGLEDEINLINAHDILFVAAAGNESSSNDITPKYPANYSAPNVIAVAATDNEKLAGFSNYSATKVHLGAPGQLIVSTIRSGGYSYFNGTSMATSHVAGAALLTLAACPSLSTAALKSAILSNVDPLPDLQGYTITGGRLNVNKAVRSCLPVSTTVTGLVSSANPATAGASVTFTATVSGSSPTGSVNFTDGGVPINGCGAIALGVSGNTRKAYCTTASLKAGSHSIVASYSGDGNNAASASPPLSQVINPTSTLMNSGFETPFLGAAYQSPTGPEVGWSFFTSAGIQGNGSGFGAAAAPEGTQTAYIQGVGKMTQTLTLNPGTYALVFQAARRAYSVPADSVQPVQVSVDGIPVGVISPPGTSFSSFAVEFPIGATGPHTIEFAGTDGNGDKSTFIDDVVVTSGASPANPSFEFPALGSGYQYAPAGAGWSFSPSSGIHGNGSVWGGAAAPHGTQTAFIQSVGVISQTLSLNAGDYMLSLQAAHRSHAVPLGGVQPIRVSMNGIPIGLISPVNTSFSGISIPFSVPTNGAYTLEFAGTDGFGDKTTFLDAIAITASAYNSFGERIR